MTKEQAKEKTISLRKRDAAKWPSRNDFSYEFEHQGKMYIAQWSRDVSISSPEWHFSYGEVTR